MGLSCDNPSATANLRPGEVVVDLGSGVGLDVFLAAKQIGPTGKAIGIDMSVIEQARVNAEKGGYTNVEFHWTSIDSSLCQMLQRTAWSVIGDVQYVMNLLPAEVHPELDSSGIERAVDGTEQRVSIYAAGVWREPRIRQAELRMVEHVECLCSELQNHVLR